MSTLKLQYFGPLRAELNGIPLTLRTTKTAALLAYLALEGTQPQPRVHLSTLLWDGYEQQTARSSLRVALTYLRQALVPFQPIEVLHKSVRWVNAPGTVWSDVQAFEEITRSLAEQDPHQRWLAANEIYKGEFLLGWENIDSAPFQQWVLKRRADYQEALQQLMQRAQPNPVRKALAQPATLNRHNLRRPLTPLMGRAAAVDHLRQLLLAADAPLVVLVGEGGIGKTRLALATAWSLITGKGTAPFADGLWFVPLNTLNSDTDPTQVEPIEQIAEAISTALGLRFSEGTTVLQPLLTWLRDKALLLILDDVEHLPQIETFIDKVLQTTQQVKILVTSRRRLKLQTALTFPVPELTTPDDMFDREAPIEQLQSYPSVQLFVERVQRIRMDFQLDSHNGPVIAQICRLVGGIPLAIELAAAMMAIYSAPKLAEQLAQDAVTLQVTWTDLSLQHQSIEKVMAASWRLLSSAEARLLSQCTVLVGTFSLAALLNIGEAKPLVVRALIEKSLLRIVDGESDRFMLHDLVRQYANQQLLQQPDLVTTTRARHAAYYLTLLQNQEAALPNQRSGQQIIYAELANIRAAWQWVIEQRDLPLLESSYSALGWFYRVTGLTLEGFTVFVHASQAVLPPFALDQVAGRQAAQLRARLLLYVSEFGGLIGRWAESQTALAEAQGLGEQLADKLVLALVDRELAMLAFLRNDFPTMYTHARQAVATVKEIHSLETEVMCLYTFCVAAQFNQDYATERGLYAVLLRRLTHLSNRLREGWVKLFLGRFYTTQWEYTVALTCLQDALAHHRELNSPGARYSLIALGHTWYELGALDQAEAMLTAATVDLPSRMLPIWAALQQMGIALVQDAKGNYAIAQQHFSTGSEIASAHCLAYIELQCHVYQGYSLMSQGALRAADNSFQQSLQLAPRLRKLGRAADAHAGVAQIRLLEQDRPAAQAAVDAALRALAQDGLDAAWAPFRTYWYCYQTLQSLHDVRASQLLAEAHRALFQIANKIIDPGLKQSFLEKVPANRALIAAMAAQR